MLEKVQNGGAQWKPVNMDVAAVSSHCGCEVKLLWSAGSCDQGLQHRRPLWGS